MAMLWSLIPYASNARAEGLATLGGNCRACAQAFRPVAVAHARSRHHPDRFQIFGRSSKGHAACVAVHRGVRPSGSLSRRRGGASAARVARSIQWRIRFQSPSPARWRLGTTVARAGSAYCSSAVATDFRYFTRASCRCRRRSSCIWVVGAAEQRHSSYSSAWSGSPVMQPDMPTWGL